MSTPKLKELNEAFGTVKKEFDTIKADLAAPGEEMCSKQEVWAMLDRCMSSVYNMVDSLYTTLGEVNNTHWENHSNHQKGHAPAFKTASQLKAFLKTCGMAEDYDVIKPAIFASTNRGLEVTLDYSQVKNSKG